MICAIDKQLSTHHLTYPINPPYLTHPVNSINEHILSTGFTHAQQQCYAITLRIVDSGLLATVGLALDTMFFYDSPSSSQQQQQQHNGQDASPRAVLYTLSTRLQRMLCARDLAGKEHDGEKVV